MCDFFLEIVWNLRNNYYFYITNNNNDNQNTHTMTTQEFTNVAKQKFSALSVSELKKAAISLSNDFSTAANLMDQVIMDLLIERMPEQEFIKFCNEL